MVMVQLGVSLSEALARLRAHAFASDQDLADLAADVLAERVHLSSERDGRDYEIEHPTARNRTMISTERLSDLFVEVADTLVDDFDVIDFLHNLTVHAADISGASAVGLMLTDQQGHLQFMAASNSSGEHLELYQLQNVEGPCLDCFATGQPVAERRPGQRDGPVAHLRPARPGARLPGRPRLPDEVA